MCKVNTIEINYAKTAKKMDMKRLKTTMWGLLTDCLEKPVEETATVSSSLFHL